MQASAVEDGWQGYAEWSQELEQSQIVDTSHGQILINRDCSYKACLTTRCEMGATYQSRAIHALGAILYESGRFDEAAKYYTKAIKANQGRDGQFQISSIGY